MAEHPLIKEVADKLSDRCQNYIIIAQIDDEDHYCHTGINYAYGACHFLLTVLQKGWERYIENRGLLDG